MTDAQTAAQARGAGKDPVRPAVRHFLKDSDLSPAEQAEVLDLAAALKAAPHSRTPLAHGDARETIAVIFDKTSTRTRFSFAAGIGELGGQALVVNPGESQIGHKESVEDTARILERTVSAIVWRTFGQAGLETMARFSRVPVVNALSDEFHPCQILADLLTVREEFGTTAGRTLAYIGDAANNMASSYALGGALAGMHVRLCGPQGYRPDPAVVEEAQRIAEETGGSVAVLEDPRAAAEDADVVTTDTWVSMGQEGQKSERAGAFEGFRVTAELMGLARPEAVFLHCLPAYRGVEVDAEVIDGPQSRVWDEAENRRHAQKALLVWLLQRAEASSSFADRRPEVSA